MMPSSTSTSRSDSGYGSDSESSSRSRSRTSTRQGFLYDSITEKDLWLIIILSGFSMAICSILLTGPLIEAMAMKLAGKATVSTWLDNLQATMQGLQVDVQKLRSETQDSNGNSLGDELVMCGGSLEVCAGQVDRMTLDRANAYGELRKARDEIEELKVSLSQIDELKSALGVCDSDLEAKIKESAKLIHRHLGLVDELSTCHLDLETSKANNAELLKAKDRYKDERLEPKYMYTVELSSGQTCVRALTGWTAGGRRGIVAREGSYYDVPHNIEA